MFSVISSVSKGDGPGIWEIMIYEKVEVNRPEGVYNRETGQFTAPVTGFYFFLVDCSAYASRSIELRLMVGSQDVVYGRDQSGTGSCGANVIQLVAKGTTVHVDAYRSSSYGIRQQRCHFSGFFLDSNE